MRKVLIVAFASVLVWIAALSQPRTSAASHCTNLTGWAASCCRCDESGGCLDCCRCERGPGTLTGCVSLCEGDRN
jgi:hypothetical protein